MKCPKYIKKALDKRAKAAEVFIKQDGIIYDYLEKHKIDVMDYDILTGCESLVNPHSSSQRIYAAILKKE